MRDMIVNGISFSKEAVRMTPFRDKLSYEDVPAVLAYMRTFWTGEQQSWQTTVTAGWQESPRPTARAVPGSQQ